MALILRGVDQILPADGAGYEHGSLTSLLREWATEAPFCELPFTSLLIADNLNDVEPLVAFDAHAARIARAAARRGRPRGGARAAPSAATPAAFAADARLPASSRAPSSASRSRRSRAWSGCAPTRAQPIDDADLRAIKKELVERDAGGLVEFVESPRTLDDYQGQQALKRWLRQDIALWRAGDLKALPEGYLLCGPVGTGKTFLVECLAGEAGVPVVKLKNFRDRWVGSSEGNLEKIFRLVRALGRCMVFIDEADQALGRRESGSGDSGLSGRLYSMIAQEMADPANRGRVVWILASSRPDLIEVDLKRPGRVDVKVPLLPTTTPAESAQLVGALAKRYGLALDAAALEELEPRLPTAAHAGRRRGARGEGLSPRAHAERSRRRRRSRRASRATRTRCRPTCSRLQMRLAVREATDLAFVPPAFRKLADAPQGRMKRGRSYLWAAFNARPFGMPVPPNWFGVAAFGLLGAFVHPGFWLIGAGVEGLYLWALSRQRALPRDGRRDERRGGRAVDSRYRALADPLDAEARAGQAGDRAAGRARSSSMLGRTGANEAQIARGAADGVAAPEAARRARLVPRRSSRRRSARTGASTTRSGGRTARLRRGDDGRRAAPQPRAAARGHRARGARRTPTPAGAASWSTPSSSACASRSRSCASRRCSPPTSRASPSPSTRSPASLNEANRWLKDQRELFAGLESLTDEPPPAELLQPKGRAARRQRASERASEEAPGRLGEDEGHEPHCRAPPGARLGRRERRHPAALRRADRPRRLPLARAAAEAATRGAPTRRREAAETPRAAGRCGARADRAGRGHARARGGGALRAARQRRRRSTSASTPATAG